MSIRRQAPLLTQGAHHVILMEHHDRTDLASKFEARSFNSVDGQEPLPAFRMMPSSSCPFAPPLDGADAAWADARLKATVLEFAAQQC